MLIASQAYSQKFITFECYHCDVKKDKNTKSSLVGEDFTGWELIDASNGRTLDWLEYKPNTNRYFKNSIEINGQRYSWSRIIGASNEAEFRAKYMDCIKGAASVNCQGVSDCLTQEPSLSTIQGIINNSPLNCDTVVNCVLDNIGTISDALANDIFDPANAPNAFLDSLSSNIDCNAVIDCVADSFDPTNQPNALLDSLSSYLSTTAPTNCDAVEGCVTGFFDPANQPNSFIDSLESFVLNNGCQKTFENCEGGLSITEKPSNTADPDTICFDLDMSYIADNLAEQIFDPANQPNAFLDSLNNNVTGGSGGLTDPCDAAGILMFHTIEIAAAGPLTTGQQDASILATSVAGGGSLTHGSYNIVSVTQNCEVGNATTQLYANGAAIAPTFGNGVTAISHSGGPGENIFIRTFAANGASHCWYSIGILTEIPPCP